MQYLTGISKMTEWSWFFSKAKLAHYSSFLLTSDFCIPVPYDEKDIFFFFLVLVLESLVGLHRSIQLLQHWWLGPRLGFTVILNGLPWKQTEIILLFWRLHTSAAL